MSDKSYFQAGSTIFFGHNLILSSFVNAFWKASISCGFALLSLFVCQNVLGQIKDSVAQWHRGKLILEDSLRIEGLISYKIGTRLIEVKPYSIGEILVFHEKRITFMVITDARTGIENTFQLLRVSDADSGFKGQVLFQILLRMNGLLVVSRMYPMNKNALPSGSGRMQMNNDSYENFYVLGDDGDIKLLATFPPGEQRVYPTRVKPYLNDALLVRSMENHWKQVKTYAKKQKLRLKTKEGLLKALQYYQTLQN